MSVPRFIFGEVIRYGSGPTALMRVESASLTAGTVRYFGEQYFGGAAAAYDRDCSAATVEDLEKWERRACAPSAADASEISGRIDQLKRGEVKADPWSEVEARIRRTIGRISQGPDVAASETVDDAGTEAIRDATIAALSEALVRATAEAKRNRDRWAEVFRLHASERARRQELERELELVLESAERDLGIDAPGDVAERMARFGRFAGRMLQERNDALAQARDAESRAAEARREVADAVEIAEAAWIPANEQLAPRVGDTVAGEIEGVLEKQTAYGYMVRPNGDPNRQAYTFKRVRVVERKARQP